MSTAQATPTPPTPTGNLILMYLTARARLGTHGDYLEPRYLNTLRKLEADGWVHVVKESNTMGMVTVDLTDQARAAYSSPDWVPPAIRTLQERVQELELENVALRALAQKAL